jgi:hypothetical protein
VEIAFFGDPTNYFAGMLYFALMELAGSVIVLRRNSRIAGVSAKLRSAVDAFVDIKSLLNDSNYWRNLEAADSAEWKKILQAASMPGNDFLAGFAADPKLSSHRGYMKKKGVEAKAAKARH